VSPDDGGTDSPSPGRPPSAGANRVPPPVSLSPQELRLIEALRRRDESAFLQLVELYHNSLLRVAQLYVPRREVAEEVVQETWLGLLTGIDRFEGRSSLKTWLFRILTNRAKTRGERESRTIPFSALWNPSSDPDEVAVELDRFLPPDHPQLPHHWAAPPQSWGENPEQVLLAQETRSYLQKAIDSLPPAQREVITLRDIEGLSSQEVCNILGVSETNQRVLLHRARSRVRRELERYFTNA